jgi:hypothetical protein
VKSGAPDEILRGIERGDWKVNEILTNSGTKTGVLSPQRTTYQQPIFFLKVTPIQKKQSTMATTQVSVVSNHQGTTPPPCTPIDAITTAVFSSVDLLREILLYLMDEPDTLLLEAHALSKSFYAAIMDSDQIWKAVCRHRWIRKWGFHHCWQAALDGSSRTTTTTTTTTTSSNSSSSSTGQFWRRQYVWHERDAQRSHLTPEELTCLTFDFRFWVMEYFWGQEHVLQSGLRVSVASNFSFLPSSSSRVLVDNDDDDDEGNITNNNNNNSNTISHQGLLYGHPSNRDDLEWFLDEDGLGLQWGKTPHLWPKAKIVRLDSWGWEIRNLNVCLRAINPAMVVEEEENLTTTTLRDRLWADLIASIQSDAVILGPEQGGMGIVRIEVPPQFWEFRQNRLRFPRLERESGVCGHL